MSLIKRHKGLAIVGGLTLVLIIVMFAIFARMIFSTGDSEYGQRLTGLVELDNKVTKEIVSSLLENDSVKDAEIRVQGRIIYTIIIFNEGTNLDKAKEIANGTVIKYSDSVLEDYDLGFFIKEDVENTEDEVKVGFVSAGTKHPSMDMVSWTKKQVSYEKEQ